MPAAQRGDVGVFPARNSRPPGQCREHRAHGALSRETPGTECWRQGAKKKSRQEQWRGERGPMCERCGRRPSWGWGGGVGNGWTGGWMDGWMDGRSPPPGDGPPPSAMKWWGRCSWPPLPSQPRSPWERPPQGAALDLHAGARRGNRAEVSELIGGEQWSVALPVRDMCLFRVHRGPSGRPPPWAPGPHCPVSVGASVQPRLGSEPPFPSAGAHVRPAGGPVSNGSHPALSQR